MPYEQFKVLDDVNKKASYDSIEERKEKEGFTFRYLICVKDSDMSDFEKDKKYFSNVELRVISWDKYNINCEIGILGNSMLIYRRLGTVTKPIDSGILVSDETIVKNYGALFNIAWDSAS